jgi:4-hydroxybenzoate polyprenyltransferase/phosphoserine phosphatase
MNAKVLCVDLDGTLVHTDLLLESLLLLVKANPLYLLLIPFWLLSGKAAFKEKIARRVDLNAAALPYNQALLEWLRVQRAAGYSLWLCTAASERLARAVAGHLGIFDGLLASSTTHNLSGAAKARALADRFGPRAFDYCGNHRVDLAIWRVSAGAIVVNAGSALAERARALCEVRAVFPRPRMEIRSMLRALRPHQWAKNLLVFVPLAAAHRLGDLGALQQSLLAFLAFCCCASATYLLNDMLDLEADRLHPRKRTRALAAGALSLPAGLVLAALLVMLAIGIGWLLPPDFRVALAIYALATLAYSFGLKRLVLIDTVTLAALYTLRIIAGALAIDVPLSFWLLLFSIFLFNGLALVKRYAELEAMQREGRLTAAGRGYHVNDLVPILVFGVASSYMAVLVLGLYINSRDIEALYRQPRLIWPLCVVVLFWVSHMWLKAHRGQMNDDPVLFALKDPLAWVLGAVCALSLMLAT